MTTDELIRLCEQSVVPVEAWRNRDTADAQRQVGEALALLRAGAEWRESTDPKTDASTIWIDITFPGFNAFEEGRSERAAWDSELFYIPTAERLARRAGEDWY